MRRHLLALSAILAAASISLTAGFPAQQAATAPAIATLASSPDQQFTANDVTLRYRDVGAGDPIVFIHGYSATLETMLGVANALPAGHRKVALDVRGFGRSTKFGDPSKFGQRMVDDVVELMDHLRIQRAHLVGHSMGAMIAANVMARYPARVSSASLVAGPFWGEPDITTESARWTADLENGKGLLRFALWLFPGMTEQAAAATSAGIMKANDLASLTASMRALPALSITGIKDEGNKVLLVAGTADPLFPLSTAFAKQTPGSKMVEIPGANHMTVITHTDAVKAMTDQLRR